MSRARVVARKGRYPQKPTREGAGLVGFPRGKDTSMSNSHGTSKALKRERWAATLKPLRKEKRKKERGRKKGG